VVCEAARILAADRRCLISWPGVPRCAHPSAQLAPVTACQRYYPLRSPPCVTRFSPCERGCQPFLSW
jgi:hypothetical protein